MAFVLPSYSQIAVTVILAIVASTLTVLTTIAVNEERLKVLEQHQKAFEEKKILPGAELRVTAAEIVLEMQGNRIGALEEFMHRGKRCTFSDCERLKVRMDRIQDSQTACLSALATNTYRLDLVEKNFRDFLFDDKD